jgi:hypothetical protein
VHTSHCNICVYVASDMRGWMQVEEKWKHTTSDYFVHVFKRTRWFVLKALICARTCKRRCRCMHNTGTTSRSYDELDKELWVLNAEHCYNAAMRAFIRAAEKNTGVDLLKYMEDIKKTATSKRNVYIGLQELCSLCRDRDAPIDPFCMPTVDHRWKNLGSSIVEWMQHTSKEPVKQRTRCNKCCCTPGTPITRSPTTQMSTRMFGRPSSKEISPNDIPRLTPDFIKSVYKPRCLAWRVAQAYADLKDVFLLGPTEKHAFSNENLVDPTSGDVDTVDPNKCVMVGSWVVTKVNRSQMHQTRNIVINEEAGVMTVCARFTPVPCDI